MSAEKKSPPIPEIELWEDDCGLSDLARDVFAQLQQIPTAQQDQPDKPNE
jgi:hypothetical protein